MNVLITLDPKEILKNIGLELIKEFIKEESQEESSKELWEKLEEKLINENKNIEEFIVEKTSSDSLLQFIHDDNIEEYVGNHTDLYVSNEVSELMEQIDTNGEMDQVIDLFTIKYNGI